MTKHESALDLFQRLHINGDSKHQVLVDRLNGYHQLFFPSDAGDRGHLIELLDKNRTVTKAFLHGFISDSIEYMRYRNELLLMPMKSEETVFSSPQANKDSLVSEVPTLQMKLSCDQSIIFLYIDTEYKECPFTDEFVHWYDCETSTALISTLLRLEQSCFITYPDRRYVLIIDSSTQIPINDYFLTVAPSQAMSVEENKLFSIQWHTVLCHLLRKYRLSCILVERLDVDVPIFDRLISRRDDKSARRTSKNNDLHIPFSDFAFGRLMNSEHYMNGWHNQLDYRQIRGDEMLNFQYQSNRSSLTLSVLDANDHIKSNNEGVS